MHIYRRQLLLGGLKFLDVLLMLLALTMSMTFWGMSQSPDFSLWRLLQIKLKVENLLLLVLFIPLWHLVFLSMKLYDSRRLERGQGEWLDIIKAVFIGTMFLLVASVLLRRNNLSREVLLVFAVLTSVLTWGGRTMVRLGLELVRRYQRNLRNILLVGSNPRVYEFARGLLSKPQLGYRIVGYIDDPYDFSSVSTPEPALKHLGALKEFNEVIESDQIDEVLVALPIRSCYEHIQQIIKDCETQGIQVHLLSDFFQVKLARARVAEFEGAPILTLATGALSAWDASLKRAFDLTVGVVLVTVLSPVFLLIALLIKLCSPGSVFFVQARVGYNRRRFKMIKFRTMVPHAERLQPQLEALNEARGPVFKIKHDPRITPIGRVLRKTSLDELPQLLNVIKGDMSLVGPRPLPLRDVEKFESDWLKRRFSVKPGMTCLWQVNGRSQTHFDTWIKQDLEYIDRWSWGLDLKILAKTIPTVLRGTGAH